MGMAVRSERQQSDLDRSDRTVAAPSRHYQVFFAVMFFVSFLAIEDTFSTFSKSVQMNSRPFLFAGSGIFAIKPRRFKWLQIFDTCDLLFLTTAIMASRFKGPP